MDPAAKGSLAILLESIVGRIDGVALRPGNLWTERVFEQTTSRKQIQRASRLVSRCLRGKSIRLRRTLQMRGPDALASYHARCRKRQEPLLHLSLPKINPTMR